MAVEEALVNQLLTGAIGQSPLALLIATWYVVNRVRGKNGNGNGHGQVEVKDLTSRIESIGHQVERVEKSVEKVDKAVLSNHDDLVRFMAEMRHLDKGHDKMDARLSKVEQCLFQLPRT